MLIKKGVSIPAVARLMRHKDGGSLLLKKYTQGFEEEETGYDYTGLAVWVNQTFPVGLGEEELKNTAEQASETPPEGSMYDGLTREQYALCHFIFDAVQEVYRVKIKTEDPEALVHVERRAILVSIDRLWREHLYAMDGLRQSVHLLSLIHI